VIRRLLGNVKNTVKYIYVRAIGHRWRPRGYWAAEEGVVLNTTDCDKTAVHYDRLRRYYDKLRRYYDKLRLAMNDTRG
jgi:hypothetical protein